MKLKIYLLSILLFLITTSIEALDPSKSFSSYRHKTWQYEDGLPQNTISIITQTKDGYLWLGTKEGLIRFDGIEFDLFNKKNIPELEDEEIADLFADSKGNLWIGTRNGALKYRDGKIHKYSMDEGLTDNNIWDIFEDSNGNIWFGTGGGGLSVFDGIGFKNYSVDSGFISNFIWCIFEDSKGIIWIGTDGDGLIRFDGKEFYQVEELFDFEIDYIFEIAEDSKSNLYFATADGLLVNIDGEFDLLTADDGITHDFLWNLHCDKDDNVWIGSEGGGLFLLNNFGVQNFSYKDGLSSDMISSIYEDEQNNIWVATRGGGINRFKDKLLTTLLSTNGELSSDFTYSVYEYPVGTIWVGTNNGLNRIKDGKTKKFDLADGLSSLIITSFASDKDGNLWIGTDGFGLNKYSENGFEAISMEDGLTGNSVWALEVDNENNLWIAVHGSGINILKDGEIKIFDDSVFIAQFVTDFYLDKENRMWISSIDEGVYYYEDNKFFAFGNLSNTRVRSIYQDSDGLMWFTTDDGLCKVVGDSVRFYGESEGLSEETIYSLIEYSPGDFWLGTDEGILRISKTNIELFDQGLINIIPSIIYGIDEGMEAAECAEGDPSVLKSYDGFLYYPTIRGVTIIDPADVRKEVTQPDSRIKSLNADGKIYSSNNEIILPAGTGRVEINYTSFYYTSPTRIQFQYLLEGFDENWISVGNKRSATFTQLPPGKYTFKVRASINNKWDDDHIQTITFTKDFFFWETRLFQGLFLLTLLVLPFGAYWYRLNLSKKRNTLLEQLVNERTVNLTTEIEQRKQKEAELQQTQKSLKETIAAKDKFFAIISHDLRSPFQGLLGFSELLYSELDNFSKEDIKLMAGSINKLSRNFITQLNNLLEWSRLQRGVLEIKRVDIVLHELVDSIFLNLHSSYLLKNLQMVNDVDDSLIVYSDENILQSALSNLITNAIKFSHKGGKIIIGAKQTQSFVEIWVTDFGVGLSDELKEKLFSVSSDIVRHGTENELGSGLGLVLINDLIRSQNGKISVESELGKGSTFIIQLPINAKVIK